MSNTNRDDIRDDKQLATCRLSQAFAGHVSHGSPCQTCTDEYKKAMSFQPDAGPWTASEDGSLISSDDFTYDATLQVKGDFWDDRQRHLYAQQIAADLNEAAQRRRAKE